VKNIYCAKVFSLRKLPHPIRVSRDPAPTLALACSAPSVAAALLALALDCMAPRWLGVTRRQLTGDAAAGWALIGDQTGVGLGRGNP
jgi:hypothetical protein